MKNLLKATAIAAMLLTAVACTETETTTSNASNPNLSGDDWCSEYLASLADENGGVPAIGCADEPSFMETPKELAEMILGWDLKTAIPMIEYNGQKGSTAENLSPAWRIMWEDGRLVAGTADIVYGRYNLAVENGIIIGIIVEQMAHVNDIHVGVTKLEELREQE